MHYYKLNLSKLNTMLEEIMKSELEKQEGVKVEIKDEVQDDGESRPAFLDNIVEEMNQTSNLIFYDDIGDNE